MSQEGLSREEFKIAALIFLGMGLSFLIAFYISIINIIGDILLNIAKNSPLLFAALFHIMLAIIFGVGYFIEDKNDRAFYLRLIYLLGTLMFLIAFSSDLIPIPKSILVGFVFLIYTSLPFAFMVYKGLKSLINPKGS